MNEPKLKPCPFCGGEPRIELIFGGSYAVKCRCGAYMDAGSYLDDNETQKAKSARAWNKRMEIEG